MVRNWIFELSRAFQYVFLPPDSCLPPFFSPLCLVFFLSPTPRPSHFFTSSPDPSPIFYQPTNCWSFRQQPKKSVMCRLVPAALLPCRSQKLRDFFYHLVRSGTFHQRWSLIFLLSFSRPYDLSPPGRFITPRGQFLQSIRTAHHGEKSGGVL